VNLYATLSWRRTDREVSDIELNPQHIAVLRRTTWQGFWRSLPRGDPTVSYCASSVTAFGLEPFTARENSDAETRTLCAMGVCSRPCRSPKGGDHKGAWSDEVDETFSSQACRCSNRPAGPKGRKVSQ
jgi:hypothetical protein